MVESTTGNFDGYEGRLSYATVYISFACTFYLAYLDARRPYRKQTTLYERYTSLRMWWRRVARDREVLRRPNDEVDEDPLGDEEVEEATKTAEALNKCPYESAMAALYEVKDDMKDGDYKTIADALLLARVLEAETGGEAEMEGRIQGYAEGMFVATVNR